MSNTDKLVKKAVALRSSNISCTSVQEISKDSAGMDEMGLEEGPDTQVVERGPEHIWDVTKHLCDHR